ncbi:penicillin-binding protein 2 [Oceanobacillus kimchii]|uniref:peptidoglycan D,D-transpeptidase FtsI family protein n=1 Tax=Oceanobacillus kimchii TaxID=746691 RepID=UPI00034C9EEA|nr:penicillin-binding protein 2 [Oceanobacillus kimchii]MCT1575896.1 penicillin-binding protein 2 [Oceanobacillus kimchii]MCT2135533.1 penicillin-binding protein 2 [Oceanobacillus kimchii]
MSKDNKKKRAQLPFRINILFFAIFLLFSVLILQLGVVQILNGEAHQEEIERTNIDTTSVPVPRGKILDTNGNVIVDNKAMYSITYTPPKGVQAKDRLELAQKLAEYIDMSQEDRLKRITDRDKREYYYLLNQKDVDERLEDLDTSEMDNADVYNHTLDLITEEEISDFSDDDMEIIAIKKELDKAYSLTPQVIKNEDVTAEEYATVAENLDKLPGINATTDWDRVYPYEDTLTSLLGSITSQQQGIPAEDVQAYLSKGYSRNDRVGKSGLEQQYEDFLRGRKEQIQYETRKDGTIVGTETVVEGQRGKDLVLTIDMEFQEKVDEIVLEEFKDAKEKYPGPNQYLTNAFAVVMNPKTGELLAMSGVNYDKEKGEYNDAAFMALASAYEPGSSVKGASVLAGYESGVISPGQVFFDNPIRIASTPVKKSVSNLGHVNDYQALEKSSNVYMFYIALRMMGENRHPYPDNSSLNASWSEYNNALNDLQNYFNQFGLGASTGIDFPYESTGVRSNSAPNPGNVLDFTIGQYDTYTTLQLAQYVSTIANDGYRVQPHFLKQVHDPIASFDELGPVYYTKNTQVMNRIDMSQSEIERVQEGFRRVYSTGTARNYFNSADYTAAGKTGTAETSIYEDGKKLADTNSLSLVGYAPFDEPEVAFAVIVPHTGEGNGINNKIGRRILDAYFEVKEEQDEEEAVD